MLDRLQTSHLMNIGMKVQIHLLKTLGPVLGRKNSKVVACKREHSLF